MILLDGVKTRISVTGTYLYQVKTSAGTAKLTFTDKSDTVVTDVTNSSKSADFTGTLDLASGWITATLTGDAQVTLSPANQR